MREKKAKSCNDDSPKRSQEKKTSNKSKNKSKHKFKKKGEYNNNYSRFKEYKDFLLILNGETFKIKEYESKQTREFIDTVNGFFSQLNMTEEARVLVWIQIYNKLDWGRSKHFDDKEYKKKLFKFMELQ